MLFAIVLLLVFMILGLTVVTRASTSLSAVNRREVSRQTYYYARSTLTVLDESLKQGELGRILRDNTWNNALFSGEDEYKIERTLTPDIAVTSSLISDYTVENVEISYEETAVILGKDENDIPISGLVSLDDVTISFTAVYNNKKYDIRATYAYIGWCDRINDTIWEWNEEWTLQKLK